MLRQQGIQRFVDQRGLAAAAYTGHYNQFAQAEFNAYILSGYGRFAPFSSMHLPLPLRRSSGTFIWRSPFKNAPLGSRFSIPASACPA
jgi:hypothetical protein